RYSVHRRHSDSQCDLLAVLSYEVSGRDGVLTDGNFILTRGGRTSVYPVDGLTFPASLRPAPGDRFAPGWLAPIVFGSFLAHWERQTCNMGKHLSHSSPAAEIEAEQLVGAFRRGAPHPPTDEQTGNQGHRDLQVHPIFTVTEQMATPQETFNPAEEQVHGPPITIREGKEVRVQVQPMSHPDHCDRRPSRVGFVRGHPHPPQRRRGAGARLSRSHAAPHDVRSHPRGL